MEKNKIREILRENFATNINEKAEEKRKREQDGK